MALASMSHCYLVCASIGTEECAQRWVQRSERASFRLYIKARSHHHIYHSLLLDLSYGRVLPFAGETVFFNNKTGTNLSLPDGTEAKAVHQFQSEW